MIEPKWLLIARELQALAQNGLTFAKDPFDRERYESIRAIAAKIVAENGPLDAPLVESIFSRESGYATPKVEVRGAVFHEGRVLLVREVADGLWSLPGGWADVHDSPSAAVKKEIEQEAGLVTAVKKLAAVFDRSLHPHQPPYPYHIYKLFFICEWTSGALSHSIETSEAGFFAEDALPPLSLGRVLPFQIQRMFEHHRQPGLATEFD
jgi:ADP-ribose pyrophosphatase YjhB (NUDIX family)